MGDIYIPDSKWIWYEDQNTTGKIPGDHEIVYFRRNFTVSGSNARLHVKVSADSRYRLYLNGVFVSAGPCKGDSWKTYYEEIDLTPWLKPGINLLAAKVLHLSNRQPYDSFKGGPISIYRSSSGAFLLDGALEDEDGNLLEDLSTGTEWKTRKEQGIGFIKPVRGVWSSVFEHIHGSEVIRNWESPELDDSSWQCAVPVAESLLTHNPMEYGQDHGWVLEKRPIPLLYEQDRRFVKVTKTNGNLDQANRLFNEGKPFIVPAGTECFIEVDAGELMTGYFRLSVDKGKGSCIKSIYTECYEQQQGDKIWKGVRDDASGILTGDYDIFEPGGEPQTFETFWFRTFRFIRLEIKAGTEDLVLTDCFYRETGYPFEFEGQYHSSDLSHTPLWDISVRSLKRCTHDTYEDCPYYEQLQYAMDTRLQALFTYQLTSDDRLARKAIEDFHSSLMPSGLLQSRYPSVMRQIIPGFSLHWIYMLEDHLMYFGDVAFIRRFRPTVDAVLEWFDRKLDKQGMVEDTGYWSFVDWVEGWDMNSVPTAARKGPMTVYSLMYAKALQTAAILNEVTGRKGIADEYRERAARLTQAVKKSCWNEERQLFTDGPDVSEFSQHVQVWAVLAGAVKGADAETLMQRMLEDDSLSKISYAMSFYLFRALEATGLYSHVDKLLNVWREMANLNLTTWVEDPVTQRSDCHGWGAVPLYEFPAVILGVRPAAVGYEKIQVKPFTESLKFAQGVVATSKGKVEVKWSREGEKFSLSVHGPAEIPMEVVLPDGTVEDVKDGVFTATKG